MSYILEALKKAQAERQLGNSPTLHAPTLQSVDRSAAGSRFKKPLVLVIIAMAVVIAALVAMVLRSSRTAAEAPAVQAAANLPAAAPAVQRVLAPQADSAPPPAAQAASASPAGSALARNRADATAPTPLPAPVAALPPPVATITPARKRAEPQDAQTVQTTSATSAPASQPGWGTQAGPAGQAGQPAQTAPPAANGAVTRTTTAAGASSKPGAIEEPVQNLRDLPEPIQRSIPQVAVGGYIYSKNAADRLLLIDKVLRREGEEVAPGLMLEKLNPKEAVFNFKGYRYRVPY